MKAQVLSPITITSAMLTASNVAEPDTSTGEVAWNALTNYAIGNEVVRTTTHRVYTAIASGVDAGLPESTPLRWEDTRPSNLWAWNDLYRSTAIRKNGTLTLTINPGIITGLNMFGLVGDSVRVVRKNAASGIADIDITSSLSMYLSGDLEWEFWYGTPKQQDALRMKDWLPDDSQVEITLTPSVLTGWAQIGILVFGNFNDLGLPQKGFKASPVDYSRIKLDPDTGEVVIVKGLSAKNINGECAMLTATEAKAVLDVIYNLLGTPVAVLISDDLSHDFLNAFGLLTGDVTDGDICTLSLSVRGMI